MHTAFEQLIQGLCKVTRYANPQQIIDGGGITFEGVTFALTYKPKADPDALFLYADFGQLDLEQQAALYPLMLQENMLMLSSREGTFSVAATNDSVVMIEKISLSAQTPESLLALLRSLAHRANYFNKHHRSTRIGPHHASRNEATRLRTHAHHG
ncbi:CesT family type III secretion system chaperone [Actimicrobium sp. CCC2.4]|uniref:CesT family type III secretion system chaperone n=1 Tax=Actimicrobium sp. CCC2.4 TaxID=3048606 RepID=UPI002AC95AE7|nr:CesT family type III secretion system chaperone [Actimicrobium sp. CCC2.4]MEB0137243.1 CesT family type III secretion system chaperone [Actimicrobium sp. CCC2.4]WPX33491.1 CesT family type III secretion system chaperone [Actimicrobium sp. CCC2.4]